MQKNTHLMLKTYLAKKKVKKSEEKLIVRIISKKNINVRIKVMEYLAKK